jgi:RNA polymerase sigma-B factor
MAATAELSMTTPVDHVSAPTAPAFAEGRAEADLWLSWDPEQLRKVAPNDARAMSKVLFARLADTEEGTREYQYVRNTLVELNVALVRFAARRFATRSEPMEDIVQVGVVGLIKAINRFDPSQEVEFPTFAMPTIVGEIKRFFRDTSWAVHVPRRLQELRLALAKATDTLAFAHGRPPTTAELAAHLDLPEAEVREGLVAANGYSVSSIDAHAPGEDDSGDGSAFTARLGEVDPAMNLVVDLETLKPLVARLPQRDRAILSLRFGAEMTQSEIADQIGVSQMHVSRLLARTLGTLRSQMTQD